MVLAIDGVGNKTTRLFNTLIVEDFGKIIDERSSAPIEDAKVAIYFFDKISKSWLLWEAESFGQTNPQQTSLDGTYSFMPPAGRYYLEAKAPGYKTSQSQIIDVQENTIVNPLIQLSPKPKINLKLPLIGKVVFSIPDLSPPQTLKINLKSKNIKEATNSLLNKTTPDFSLPDLENNEISANKYTGKKLLLSFIAPWSLPSQEQSALLSQLADSKLEDAEILAVSLQESTAAAKSFTKRSNYSFPVVADKNGITADDYGVTLLPHHVFIDETGTVKDTYTGVLIKEELLERLRAI